MDPSEKVGVHGDVSQRSADKLARRLSDLMHGAFGISTTSTANDTCDSNKPKRPEKIQKQLKSPIPQGSRRNGVGGNSSKAANRRKPSDGQKANSKTPSNQKRDAREPTLPLNKRNLPAEAVPRRRRRSSDGCGCFFGGNFEQSVLYGEDPAPQPESSAENKVTCTNGGNGEADVFADFIAQQIEALLREKARLAKENEMLERENSQLHELLISNLEATHLDDGALDNGNPDAWENGVSEAAALSPSGSRLQLPPSSSASSAGQSSSWTTCSEDADYLEDGTATTMMDDSEVRPSSTVPKDGEEAELEAETMEDVQPFVDAKHVSDEIETAAATLAAAVIDDVTLELSCSLPMEPSIQDSPVANGKEPIEPDAEIDETSISRRLDFGEPVEIQSTTSLAPVENTRVHLVLPVTVPTWGRMREDDEYSEDANSEVSSEDEDDGLAFWEDSELGAMPPIVENTVAEELTVNDEDQITAYVEHEAENPIRMQQHLDDWALEMPSPTKTTAMVWAQNPSFEDQMALPSRTTDLTPATPEQRPPSREEMHARMCRLSPERRVLWKSPLSPAQILARHPLWEARRTPFDEAWSLPLRGILSRPDANAQNKHRKAGFMRSLRRVLVVAAGGGFVTGIVIGLASAGGTRRCLENRPSNPQPRPKATWGSNAPAPLRRTKRASGLISSSQADSSNPPTWSGRTMGRPHLQSSERKNFAATDCS